MFFSSQLHRLFTRAAGKFEVLKPQAQARADHFKKDGALKKYTQITDLIEHLTTLQKRIPLLLDQGFKAQAFFEIRAFRKGVKALKGMTRSFGREVLEIVVLAATLIFLRTFVFGFYTVPTGSAETNILVGDRVWGNKFVYQFQSLQYGEMIMFENPEFNFAREGSFAYYWQKYVGFGVPFLGLPDGPDLLTKRVIGLPGDVIEGRIENGKTVIYRNGKKLHEAYRNKYPLVLVYKHTGFFRHDGILGQLPLPAFLRLTTSLRRYSFDLESHRPLSEQPFYRVAREDVVKHPMTGEMFVFYPDEPEEEDVFGPITVPDGHYWMMGDSRRNSRDSRYWGLLSHKRILGRLSFVIFSIDGEEALWLFEFLKHPLDFLTSYVRWSRTLTSLSQWNGYDAAAEQKP